MGRFETAWLTSEANLAALTDLPGTWIGLHRDTASLRADFDRRRSLLGGPKDAYRSQRDVNTNGHLGNVGSRV
jgi:hypothetical protein